MNRILVIAEPSSRASAVRDALSERAHVDDVEAFVLMLWLPRRTIRRTAPRRYWRTANARMDEVLRELDAARIPADGLVTGEDPRGAVGGWVRSFRPRTILVAGGGMARRWMECVELVLAQHGRREIVRQP